MRTFVAQTLTNNAPMLRVFASAGLHAQSALVDGIYELSFPLQANEGDAGVGTSSFVSLGDKDDVSGNDMLLWWESDAATKLAVLYLDSFGNPRKFARTARAVDARVRIQAADPVDADLRQLH